MPVIGILTQYLEPSMKKRPKLKTYTSYVMSSYVHYLQSAGASVVPILVNESDSETRAKMGQIQGVLFPGGSGGYYAKGRFVFEEAKRLNDAGVVFPLFGICSGFENLAKFAATRGPYIISGFRYYGNLNLEYIGSAENTVMFEGLD